MHHREPSTFAGGIGTTASHRECRTFTGAAGATAYHCESHASSGPANATAYPALTDVGYAQARRQYVLEQKCAREPD